MAERISALAGNVNPGRFGAGGEIGVTMCEVSNLALMQVAAWPDTLATVGAKVADAVGSTDVPGPGRATVGNGCAALRMEPLKFWLLGAGAPQLGPNEGAVLDLSHSRTHVRVSGPHAATLLNRHLPLDLREISFPVGAVASTAFDHVGITLWRTEDGYDVFLPRGFALSLWQILLLGAAQFGCQITD